MIAETAFVSEERFTQEEFRRWLDRRPRMDVNRYELIQGRIVMNPPAGYPHGHLEARIVYLLSRLVDACSMGRVAGSSQGYDLPSGDTLEPDASFISNARWQAGPPPQRGRFLRIVPDLAVEILSDSTRRRDLHEKRQIYAANGVREYWVIDPDRRAVTVFALAGRAYGAGTAATGGGVPSALLGAGAIEVEAIFAGD